MHKNNSENAGQSYKAPAVHKIFQLLRVVAESPTMLGQTELVQKLGYSKSTTHGLIHALLREEALSQDSDGRKFYLGPAITDLAFSNWNYFKTAETAQPFINDIRGQIGETVFLGGLIRKRVLIMASAEAEVPIKISAPAGTTIPLFAGAVGKVFLAAIGTDRVRQMIMEKGLPRYTPGTITDEEKYLAELELVKTQGYAVDNEEYIHGIKAVAVALGNRKGLPLAVWVVGLSSTMEPVKIRQIIDVILKTTEKLRASLEESG
ncbi:MAG: IclR family transcriptional regulator [Desulfobacteraceae bacterium]|nr:MAG: IclR family transcriptional regulator [Desulfobacteraceae bacterium]